MATAAQSHNTRMRTFHAPLCTKHVQISVIGKVEFAWVKQPFLFCLFSTLTAFRVWNRFKHSNPSSSSYGPKTLGPFNLTAILVLISATSDATVVGQTTHSTGATVRCDSAAECMKGGDGRVYPLCLKQWSLRLHCLYCQVVGGHTQLQASQVVLAARSHIHTCTCTHTHTQTFWKTGGKSKDKNNVGTAKNLTVTCTALVSVSHDSKEQAWWYQNRPL